MEGDVSTSSNATLAAQMAAWEKLAMREEYGDAVAEEQAARAVEEAVWAEIQQQEAGREAEKEATWEEDERAAEEAAARINAEYEAREASRRAALESELKAKAARVAAQHRVWGRARGRIERRGGRLMYAPQAGGSDYVDERGAQRLTAVGGAVRAGNGATSPTGGSSSFARHRPEVWNLSASTTELADWRARVPFPY